MTELLAFLTPVAVIVAFFLQQVDAKRKAAVLQEKTETEATAVKEELQREAATVKQDVHTALETADGKLNEIHILVNARLTEALDKIAAFEKRLGLPPGADPHDKAPK